MKLRQVCCIIAETETPVNEQRIVDAFQDESRHGKTGRIANPSWEPPLLSLIRDPAA